MSIIYIYMFVYNTYIYMNIYIYIILKYNYIYIYLHDDLALKPGDVPYVNTMRVNRAPYSKRTGELLFLIV